MGDYNGVLLAPLLLSALVLRGQNPQLLKVPFFGDRAENLWTIRELGEGLAGEWLPSKFLVLEIKQKWCQPYQVRLDTDNGLRAVTVHPFGENVLTRIAIPLRMFSDGNPTAWLDHACRIEPTGPSGPLGTVRKLGIAVDHPQNELTFEIRSLKLSAQNPGSEILESLPVVNDLGQWTASKVTKNLRTLNELKREWEGEARRLGTKDRDLDEFGGDSKVTLNAGKFFHLEKADGRTWLVDPLGHPMFATGYRNTGFGKPTPISERRGYLTGDQTKDIRSFYDDLVATRWPNGYDGVVARAKRLMDAWGLNVGAIHDDSYTINLFAPDETLPDVWSDDWAKSRDELMTRGFDDKVQDHRIVGVFLTDEPKWMLTPEISVSAVLAGPDSATKASLTAAIAGNDTPSRRNEWFVATAERYLRTLSDVFRRHDPNHLNLGIGFSPRTMPEIAALGRLFDVDSLNLISNDPLPAIKAAAKATGKPVMVSRFAFGVPANGLAPAGIAVEDQKARGYEYRYFVEHVAVSPDAIGALWPQLVDDPVLGDYGGKNENVGFIDGLDRPYWDFVDAVRDANRGLNRIHSGKVKPTPRQGEQD